jgi:hypothetical protein
MQLRKLQTSVVAAVVAGVLSARADFIINYSDPTGDIGTGTLYTAANGGGSDTVTGGTFHLTAGQYAGGVFSLVQNPNAPGSAVISLYGGDNLGIDNQLYPNSTPLVNINGLLFNDPNFPRPVGVGLAVNIYYDSGSYHLLFDGYQYQPYFQDIGGGTMSLAPVPEPTTMIAGFGALGLLLFGAGVHSKRSVLRIGK